MGSVQALLITCEHGGNAVPARYKHLFGNAAEALVSHRGWDPGALPVAEELARHFNAPLISAKTTRLLVDLNRTPSSPAAFSEYTRDLREEEKREMIMACHSPHWKMVEEQLAVLLESAGRVAHIGVHSFTPVFKGEVRNARMSLLYDPRRNFEKKLAGRWRDAYRSRCSFPIRMNYPYKGISDGLTTALRKRHADSKYAGIELELNHEWFHSDPEQWRALVRATVDSLEQALQ